MHDLDSKLADLQALVRMARQELERLEAAILRAEALGIEAPRDTLERLQALGDDLALADQGRLESIAAELPRLPGGAAADLFADNERTIALARLADEGHSAGEIARRLGMAVGDVELRLSFGARD